MKVHRHKLPISVLVVIFTPELEVLLLERADHFGYWQSVTGSQQEGETLTETAVREVREETGIDATAYLLSDWGVQNRFEIFSEWRHRYAEGVTHNTEHVFGLRVPAPLPVAVSLREHLGYLWTNYEEAANKVFSWSNAKALRMLPDMLA